MEGLLTDIDAIVDATRDLWPAAAGARLFVTGGTGFFGFWLVASFCRANERLGLGAEAVLLTRDAAAFRARLPAIAGNPAVRLVEGDVRTFAFPEGGFRWVVHAATPTSAAAAASDPLGLFDVIVGGTRRVLDFAAGCGASGVLLTSSGAVYGRQPADLPRLDEAFAGAPDPGDPSSAYGEGKRVAEHLCAQVQRAHGLEAKIARCFAFVGPHLPLDAHYAVGNFIRDALAGGPVRVKGDGTPRRSYLYAGDLASWLWTILFRGRSGRPYNVGSEEDIGIAELAGRIAARARTGVEVARTPVSGAPPERYVPSTERARKELGLRATVGLDEALERTISWHGNGLRQRQAARTAG